MRYLENAILVLEIVKHVIKQLINAKVVLQVKFFTKNIAIKNAQNLLMNK